MSSMSSYLEFSPTRSSLPPSRVTRIYSPSRNLSLSEPRLKVQHFLRARPAKSVNNIELNAPELPLRNSYHFRGGRETMGGDLEFFGGFKSEREEEDELRKEEEEDSIIEVTLERLEDDYEYLDDIFDFYQDLDENEDIPTIEESAGRSSRSGRPSKLPYPASPSPCSPLLKPISLPISLPTISIESFGLSPYIHPMHQSPESCFSMEAVEDEPMDLNELRLPSETFEEVSPLEENLDLKEIHRFSLFTFSSPFTINFEEELKLASTTFSDSPSKLVREDSGSSLYSTASPQSPVTPSKSPQKVLKPISKPFIPLPAQERFPKEDKENQNSFTKPKDRSTISNGKLPTWWTMNNSATLSKSKSFSRLNLGTLNYSREGERKVEPLMLPTAPWFKSIRKIASREGFRQGLRG